MMLSYTFTRSADALSLIGRYEELLDQEERRRAARFLRAPDRAAFVIAHALVRCALSRHASVDPARWQFAAGKHGRPSIASPAPAGLDFNVSRAEGIAVCLVGRDATLGVDVEYVARPAPLEVADRFFAPTEVEALRRLPRRRRSRRFFELWTLKEAYIKARGLGLTLPLDRFSFTFEGEARISFAPGVDDDSSRWRFWLLEPTPEHLVAVALQAGSQTESPFLRICETVPLLDCGSRRATRKVVQYRGT